MAEPLFCVSDEIVDEVVLELLAEEDDEDDVEDPIDDVELLTLVTIKLSLAGYEQKAGQRENRRQTSKKGGVSPALFKPNLAIPYLSRVSTACGCWFA
jgi:hypothetical protein